MTMTPRSRRLGPALLAVGGLLVACGDGAERADPDGGTPDAAIDPQRPDYDAVFAPGVVHQIALEVASDTLDAWLEPGEPDAPQHADDDYVPCEVSIAPGLRERERGFRWHGGRAS